MLTKDQLIKGCVEEYPQYYSYDKDNDIVSVVLSDSNEVKINGDEFYQNHYKDLYGYNITKITNFLTDDLNMMRVYKCDTCGTYILEDESSYDDEPVMHNELNDPHCPICGRYDYNGTYWTKEMVKNNPSIQKSVFEIEYYSQQKKELEELKQKRHGLENWQLFCKTITIGKRRVKLELRVDDIRNGITGLRFVWTPEIAISLNGTDKSFFGEMPSHSIPLSPAAIRNSIAKHKIDKTMERRKTL